MKSFHGRNAYKHATVLSKSAQILITRPHQNQDENEAPKTNELEDLHSFCLAEGEEEEADPSRKKTLGRRKTSRHAHTHSHTGPGEHRQRDPLSSPSQTTLAVNFLFDSGMRGDPGPHARSPARPPECCQVPLVNKPTPPPHPPNPPLVHYTCSSPYAFYYYEFFWIFFSLSRLPPPPQALLWRLRLWSSRGYCYCDLALLVPIPSYPSERNLIVITVSRI